jgi:hypothetical protein
MPAPVDVDGFHHLDLTAMRSTRAVAAANGSEVR